MLKRAIAVFFFFLVAAGIFAISVLRTAAAKYTFTQEASPSPISEKVEINYTMPYAGRITPDDALWSLKAARDKIWVLTTFDSLKKAEILLLMADKRIQMAQVLFNSEKSDLAVSTLTKAEKYLEEAKMQSMIAKGKGNNVGDVLTNIANSSLKHRQMIEEDMLAKAPEDAKPTVINVLNYSKKTYEDSKNTLTDIGRVAPKSPYDQ